ncbi:transmembrane protein 174 [Pogona vitticeps]
MDQSCNTVEDFSVGVFSVTPCHSNNSTSVPEAKKSGATLLFSGLFLGGIGVTFMVMGWVKNVGIIRFVWTLLVGPLLLLVGVTFLLIAVCKFKMLACNSWNQREEERESNPNQTPSGRSFVFTGIRQPITFHGATVVQYIPSYPTQEGVSLNSANFSQAHSHSAPVIPVAGPPHYYTVSSVDENNSAFLMMGTRNERSTDSPEEPERMLDEGLCGDFPPPSYDKLFPNSS